MHFGKRFLITVLVLGLVISGCSNETTSTKGHLESADEAIISTNINDNEPTEVAQNPQLTSDNASKLGLSGTFLYTTASELFRWDFSTSDHPIKIAGDVESENLIIAPDQSQLIFATRVNQESNSSGFAIQRYDLVTGEIHDLYQGIGTRFNDRFRWYINGWSPDNQWVILQLPSRNAPTLILPMDPEKEAIPLDEDYPIVYWTQDNDVLVVTYDFSAPRSSGEVGPPPIDRIELMRLEEGTRENITDKVNPDTLVPTDSLVDVAAVISEALAPIGIHIIEPNAFYQERLTDENAYWPQRINPNYSLEVSIEHCVEWSIMHGNASGDEPEVVYQTSEIASIENVNVLPDGSLVFVELHYPDCKFGTPIGQLVHMHDGQVDVLADTLASAKDITAFDGNSASSRYLVSPDGHDLIWIANDKYGLENEVMRMKLDDQIAIPLMIDGESLKDVVTMMWIDLAD